MAAEKPVRAHSLNYCNNVLTVNGVEQVSEVSAREAQLKLSGNVLTVRGTGLNIVKLDKEQGVVQLETQSLQQLSYKQGGFNIKGLFK